MENQNAWLGEKRAEDARTAAIGMAPRQLKNLKDSELAVWQSRHPADSPQSHLANLEWNRRVMRPQVRAAWFAAVMGVLGTLLGTALGWWLSGGRIPPPEKNPEPPHTARPHSPPP